MKYKIGDRVRIITDKSKGGIWNLEGLMDKWLGKIMTIRDIGENYYKMEEDYGEHHNGWFWYEEMIDGLANERKIVITTDGEITKARLYNGKKLEKTATAKCSPEDEFNFKIGAELAVERLFDTNEDKYFTGKAVYIADACLKIGRTRGKIYEFKNGFYYDDANNKRPAFWDEGFTKDEVVKDGFLPIKE